MTFEELLNTKLISFEEAQTYRLFNMSDEGRSWYQRMLMDTFMDCVPPPAFSNEIFIFTDGRRSVIRDIKSTIDKIHQLLKEEEVYE